MCFEGSQGPRSRRALAILRRRHAIRVNVVEDCGSVRKAVLKGEEVIVLEDEEGLAAVLEAVRSGKPVNDAPRGANRYRPHRPV